jgi:replicative DNA helicase
MTDLVLRNTPAEMSLLGACLIDPDAVYLCDGLKPEHFAGGHKGQDHAVVWRVIHVIAGRGETPDIVTVTEELRQREWLARAGGQSYLLDLISSTPSSAHVETYARAVEQSAIRRQLAQAIADCMKLVHDPNVDQPVAEVQARLGAFMDAGARDEILMGEDLLGEYLELYAERGQQVRPSGLSTGFEDLDKLIYGLFPSKLYLVGGRPGHGKTVFVMQIAEHVAEDGELVVIASLEMDPQVGLMDRTMSRWSKMTQDQLNRGTDLDKVVREAGENAEILGNVVYIDAPMLTTQRLRGHMKRIEARLGKKIKLLVVDYLQLFADGAGLEETPRVGIVSRMLTAIKREFGIPVVAVSSLNRLVETRKDKRPQLADLRQSGQLEFDADVVMFLYRDELYDEFTPKPNVVEVNVAKHRGGPIGRIELGFQKEYVKLVPLVKGGWL